MVHRSRATLLLLLSQVRIQAGSSSPSTLKGPALSSELYLPPPPAWRTIVTTLAGDDAFGHADGVGFNASFHNPTDIVVVNGTTLFVSDSANNLIRAVDIASATVTTLAGGLGSNHSGHADGLGTSATFSKPAGLAVNAAGTVLYVADTTNNRIRAVDIATATVSTLAGGLGTNRSGHADGAGVNATFALPYGIAINPQGTALYVADFATNLIRSIVIRNATVTRLAGGGTPTRTSSGAADGHGYNATFHNPYGLAMSSGGNGSTLYVGDLNNKRVRAIQVASALVTTLAGGGSANGTAAGFADGLGTAATFDSPIGLAVDPNETTVFVADVHNMRVRAIVVSGAAVTTVAGNGTIGVNGHGDGYGNAANFSGPHGVAVSPAGDTLYVADSAFSLIRVIALYPSSSSTASATSSSTSSSTSSATSSSTSSMTSSSSSTSSSTSSETSTPSATSSLIPPTAQFNAAVSLATNFTSLTTSVGLALRCDIANITGSPLSVVLVVDYVKSDGSVALVQPGDPMNTEFCNGTSAVYRSLVVEAVGGAIVAPTVIRVNASAVVQYHDIAKVFETLYSATPASFVHINALIAAEPALLPPGASAGVTSVTAASAYQASATATPFPTSSNAPRAAPQAAASSVNLAATIGGICGAIVGLAVLGGLYVACLHRRKVHVGFVDRTADPEAVGPFLSLAKYQD